MIGNVIELEAVSTAFHSCLDEEIYFSWLEKIACISSFKGVGTSLYIKVKKDSVDWNNLREIIAIFYRYEIDMRQLSIFDSDIFPHFSQFKRKGAYYYDRIWGDEMEKILLLQARRLDKYGLPSGRLWEILKDPKNPVTSEGTDENPEGAGHN